ncbi:hypothetical protein [Actinomycetospora sp. CA-053990]|uniref:hypothetical protein n=1 Tax=Actinomycetospora sp. CA-053990 TaxID=3239891 RepID=UPI003D8E3FD0
MAGGARALAFSGVAGNGDGTVTLRRYTGSTRFDCERRSVPWAVPAGVGRVFAIAVGAEGGRPTGVTAGHAPGHGARVAGDLDTGATRRLDVTTGCDGNRGPGYGLGRGGSRGTARPADSDDGGGGGGASAIRAGDRSLLVAGGGGGAGAAPRPAHRTGRATPVAPAGRRATARVRRAPGAGPAARAISVTVAVEDPVPVGPAPPAATAAPRGPAGAAAEAVAAACAAATAGATAASSAGAAAGARATPAPTPR